MNANTQRKLVLDSTILQDSLSDIATRTGKSKDRLNRQARRYIRELVPGTSRFGHNLLIRFGRFVYRRGYDADIICDPEEVRHFRELAKERPVALVCNHRSQVDSFAIFCALHDYDLPHPFTFGGINMKLPVMGNILKGGGLVFIRRAFQDNLVYKAVLRAYIDFLVENNYPLFWAIEGTRSRTGKLVPPRFGLLSWVLDAQHRVSREDLHLVPVVVSYEQIADVQSYSDEQRGVKKKPENLGWLMKYLASFKHPLGPITVRFGAGVSVREQMDAIRQDSPGILEEPEKVVRKMVISSCRQMNDVTPVTVPSLVCLMLLQTRPRAMTGEELEREFIQLAGYVRTNGWPATFDLDSGLESTLKNALRSLEENGVIECYRGGKGSVYSITSGRDLSASYYRNNAIHFFVNGAIADLALSKALTEPDAMRRDAIFWDELDRLRDLFRFEFYFPNLADLKLEVSTDLDLRCPGWKDLLNSPNPRPWQEIHDVTPLLCHGILEPFVDAYQVVASKLAQQAESDLFDKKKFLDSCLGEAEQLYRLRRISHHETVAKAMFDTGLLVAQSRGLLDAQEEYASLKLKRQDFLDEVQHLSTRLRNIKLIAATRAST